jgi:hypothetical protein
MRYRSQGVFRYLEGGRSRDHDSWPGGKSGHEKAAAELRQRRLYSYSRAAMTPAIENRLPAIG